MIFEDSRDSLDPDDERLREDLERADPSVDRLDRAAVLARVQRGLFAGADRSVRIGRFVVIERLGTGASGVVYAAYDPKLERKVAIKVLRHDAELPADAQSRLLREAQALARLSHPHVVAVHDVGNVDGRVFIAMELLRGGTLREWVARARPRPAEVLAAYVQAGEGLAAAHAAGLVHRDFKPDNVLLDRQGRVRVVDFGLARDLGDAGMSMIEAVVTGEVPRLELDARLTKTGTVMGTPAYMAPEQHAGRPATARSDQYSFCVALYEALYGVRPFTGDTLPALAVAAERGEVDPAPPGSSVPARLRRALVRGLRPDPALRHPEMSALLDALRHDPLRRWRRRGLAALGVSALVGLTWVAADRRPDAAPTPCSGFEQRVEDYWNPARREAVARALTHRSPGDGAETWARIEPRLDAYAQAWVDARRDACEATEVRGEQSDEMRDRRVRCLDRALSHLDAASARLEEADAETVMRAAELVPERSLVDECSAEGVLDDGDPPPADPEQRRQIAALEARIVAIESMVDAGKYRDALTEASAVAAQAEALGYAPTHARARLWLGATLLHARRPHESVDALARGLAIAESGRAERTRAELSLWLVKRLCDIGQFDEARRLAASTEALYRRLARPPAVLDARVQLLWGHVEWTQGRYDDAIERFDRAIAAAQEDPDPLAASYLATAVTHRGTVALDANRWSEAQSLLERAVELRTEQDGPEHPDVAIALANLGRLHLRQGDYERAEQMLRRSLDLRQRRNGPEHPSLVALYGALGATAIKRGRDRDAVEFLRRSISLVDRNEGPQSLDLCGPLHNLGLAYLRQRRVQPAREATRRAYEIRRAALGPHHVKTIDSQYQVAYVEGVAEQWGPAREAYQRYVDLVREHRPDDRQGLIMGLIGLADVELAEARPGPARRVMQEARSLVGDQPEHALFRVVIDFNLAQAMEQQGESAPARALAERAMARAQALAHAEDQRAVIAQWLEDHPSSNARARPERRSEPN